MTSIIITLFLIFALFLFVLWVFYYITFGPMRKYSDDCRRIPNSRHYNEVREDILRHIDNAESLPCESITAKSYDGLTLYARYYEREIKDVIVLEFHGYRGHALRDFCGGSKISLDSGRSEIIAEQRSHGRSGGRTITFGIRERYDVISWINYITERFGKEVKIILSGVSMGAATVLMASELDLPGNVVGIIADCPYTSPKEIICKVARDKGVAPCVAYPLIRLAAKIFARLDTEEASAVEAVKKSSIPTLIIHGKEDRFVPYDMGKRVFEACAAKNKKMLSVEGAGHATSYFRDKELYVKTAEQFIEEILGA